VLWCVAVCCSVLRCVAVCCGLLLCAADVYICGARQGACNVTYIEEAFKKKAGRVAVCCSALQCVVVCCGVLQLCIYECKVPRCSARRLRLVVSNIWIQCHTYEWIVKREWVVAHIWMKCHTYEWVVSHVWLRCHTCEWVVSHFCMKCHTYEWVVSHIWMMDAESRTPNKLKKNQKEAGRVAVCGSALLFVAVCCSCIYMYMGRSLVNWRCVRPKNWRRIENRSVYFNMCMYMYVCIYVYMHVYMCVCVCVYICIYI